jgi:serine/threonine protein kinase
MNKDGVVKIADFGVAKIIEPEPGPALRGDAENPGTAVPGAGVGPAPNVTGVIGTPNYMAPEQLEHPGAVDHRADIYSLGVVIYQMLTGELPGQSLEPPSKKVQLDVRLDEVVLRALEKNPELRYQQVSALKTEVETILTHPQKTNTSKTTRKPMNSKNSVLIVMVALLIAAGAAFTGMTLIKPAPLRPAGVVAAWSGDGKDVVGNNTATLTDVAVASGKVGRAFSFNGKSSWIRMPASPSLDIGAGDGFTIECWIKPNAFDVNVSGAPIIEWDSATSDGLQLWSGGTVFANLKDIHDVAHNMNILITLKTNQFQHVALTYDKPSGDARFYYNGLLLTNVNFGSLTPQTTYPVNIGRRTGQPIGNGDTFGGLMDGLSLYNRALSPEEIHKIYNKSAGWFGWL